jgi:hypothetical protein
MLIALKINNAIALLMPTTSVANRDAALVIASSFLLERSQEALLRLNPGNFFKGYY